MDNLAFLALSAVIFVVPWENTVLIEGVGTVSKLVGIVALGLGVLAVATRARFRRPSVFHLLAMLFIAWGALTSFWTIDEAATHDRMIRNLQFFALACLVYEFTNTAQRRRILMLSYALGGFVAVFYTAQRFRAGIGRAGGTRFSAARQFNPNDLAFLLVLGLPMAWHYGMTAKRPWMRWLAWSYIPSALATIFLTGSRSGMVTASIALLIIPWSLPRLGFRIKVATLVTMAASVVVALAYVPAHSWQRLSTTKDEIEEGTLNARRIIWEAGYRVFNEHPFIGIGAGAFPTAVGPLLGEDRSAHNTYVSVSTEQGLIGVALFVSLIVTGVARARTETGPGRQLLLILALTLTVGLLPRAWEDKKATWFVLALIHAASGATAAAPPPGRLQRTPQPVRRRAMAHAG